MKRLIIILTVLFTTVTAQAQEPNYRDWMKFIEKTWDCRAEIKQAGQFTGCSGFAIDYMHLMDADARGISGRACLTNTRRSCRRSRA